MNQMNKQLGDQIQNIINKNKSNVAQEQKQQIPFQNGLSGLTPESYRTSDSNQNHCPVNSIETNGNKDSSLLGKIQINIAPQAAKEAPKPKMPKEILMIIRGLMT